MGLTNALSGLFSPKRPEQANMGSGFADMAKTAILKQQYEQHKAIAEQTGEEPMSFEEFIKSRQGS